MLSVRSNSITKRLILCLAAFASVGPIAAEQNNITKSGSWSGTLVSSSCNADEAFGEIPDCTKNVPGAKLSLYDDTDRVMYGLEPQELVTAHLGDSESQRDREDHDGLEQCRCRSDGGVDVVG